MQTTRMKRNRIIGAVFVIAAMYLLLRIKTYDYTASLTIQKVHPNDVWEFVADFSNMKFLNPTLVDFNILSESGNYEHWHYSTEYWENLSHWPYLSNVGVAHFDVKAIPNKNVFYVLSRHTTCLIRGLFCLDSTSEFKFSKSNHSDGALCEEFITYQCPVIMSRFCLREVQYQRNAIMSNLQKHFK